MIQPKSVIVLINNKQVTAIFVISKTQKLYLSFGLLTNRIGNQYILSSKSYMSSIQNSICQNSVLQSQYPQQPEIAEIPYKLQKTLKKAILYFQYGAWNQINQNISNVQSLPTQELKLNWNRRQHIIKEIYFISFPNLKILDLSHNNISSIQFLQRLNIPRIRQIMLKNNNIGEMIALKNMYCPLLEWLTLNENKIRDFQPISKMYAPNLKSLWIDNYHFPRNPKNENIEPEQIGTENLSFLFKIQSKYMQYVKLNLKDRLACPAFDYQFQRKFLHIIR